MAEPATGPQDGGMSATHRLAHRKLGSGPDVLFVHGWPLHGATWRAIVPELATSYTCHVIDLPGAGASTWTRDTRISFRSHAAAVLELIDELGLSRVALVGHDSGGGIARYVAAELGDRCTALVIGNTEIPNHHPPMLGVLVGLLRLPGGMWLLRSIIKSRRLRRSSIGFAPAFDDRRLIDGEFGRLFLEPIATNPGVQLELLRQIDLSEIDGLAEAHARITAPTALLWGKRDRWFPVSRARGMIDQFAGGAELFELEGKVFVHEERPLEWAAHAKRFLDTRVRTPRAA
jgi:pimeloyl-ACP methyl ester carboxylesterase